MKQILVIAEHLVAARHEAHYQAYKIAPPYLWSESGMADQLTLANPSVTIFYASPGGLATRAMLGRHLDEIFIIGDYTRWYVNPVGSFALMAQGIQAKVAQGAKRRWER